MDTTEFLRFVLPSSGVYFLAEPYAGGGYKHRAFTDVSELAEAAQERSSTGVNVFFACSSFKEPFVLVDKVVDGEAVKKKAYRVGTNAAFARSQWIDIDCGKGQYATQKEGAADLKRFVAEAGLPMPSVVVNSGNGLHVYWVFERDISAKVWCRVSDLFKGVVRKLNFALDDTSRTADISSVLRPAGTVNDKTHKGLGVKAVKVVGKVRSEPIQFDAWARQVLTLARQHGVKAHEPVVKVDNPALAMNDIAMGLMEYPKASAHEIAKHCAVVQDFRDTRGAAQSEGIWYATLGLLKHCVEGDDLCHEWSAGHKNYSRADCQSKLDQWKYGPTLCDKFRESSERCGACVHDVKSPITLGRIAPEPTAEAVVEYEVQELPSLPAGMETDFRFVLGQGLLHRSEDENGVTTWLPICKGYPRITDYHFDKDSKQWVYEAEVLIRPQSGWRKAALDAGALGMGGNPLFKELGGKLGVMPIGKKSSLELYMRTFADSVQQTAEEVKMHDHMGWMPDGGFLLGTTKYFKDGTVSVVKVRDKIRLEAELFRDRVGDLDHYTKLLNKMYNRPRYEGYQFTWLSGLGSVLMGLVHNTPCGVVISAYSKKSGTGKSTVCRLAQGIWGGLNQMADGNNITAIASTYKAGFRRNLPLVIDETSDWTPDRVAKFAYHYTSGQGRITAAQTGGLKDNSDVQWTNFGIISTNESVVNSVLTLDNNPAPKLFRVFEYSMSTADEDLVPADEAKEAAFDMFACSGLVGDKFLREVVPKSAEIREQLIKANRYFVTTCGLNPQARFWADAAACTLVAGVIAKRLGLHQFDMKALRDWMVERINILKGNVVVATGDSTFAFSDMMAALHSGFLMTRDDGDARTHKLAGWMNGHGPVKGAITGRVIESLGKIYVSIHSIKKWCVENKHSYNDVINLAIQNGWLVNKGKKYSLGRGTGIPVPQTNVIELNWSAFENVIRVVGGTDLDNAPSFLKTQTD